MAKRPKLLWLTQGSSSKLPSQRLRVLEMLPLLAEDFDITHSPAPTSLASTWRIRQRLRDADAVILQKELISLPVLRLLRFFSRRLAYDFDDAVYVRLLPDGHCRVSGKRQRRFSALCRAADLLIAGNEVLEASARQCGALWTAILPTGVVSPDAISPPIDRSGPVLLGWIGTDVNLPYIEAMEDIFSNLEGEGLVFTLRVMAGRAPKFGGFARWEFVPWSAEAEESFLSSLDVGLMPLADNDHARGKCAYKALQYMAYGKPVVVSDVGINAAWTASAGFAVKTEEETTDALRRLILDRDLRSRMGAAGRTRVRLEFSRPVIARQLRGLIRNLLASSSMDHSHA